MGIFDFFRKKPEIEIEKISLVMLPDFIKRKKDHIQEQEHEVYLLINTSLSYLITGLKEKISVLEKISLEGKKVEARAKFIVRENLNHYLIQLRKLVNSLEEKKTENLYELIGILDELFIDFDKRSKLNYEKATFLIGNELGEIKNSITDFLNETKRTLEKNKSSLDGNKVLSSIGLKLSELNDLKKTNNEEVKVINENNEKIKRLQIETEVKENRLNEIKKSPQYKKETEDMGQIENEKREIEKSIYDLKQLIDFKKLANIYHYDSKKMDLINQYKLSFKNSFERDNGVEILGLLSGANLADSFISRKITEIREKTKEINLKFSNCQKTESSHIRDLSGKIRDIQLRIDDISSENSRETKKLDKIKESKNRILSELNQELMKFNAELIQ